MEKSKIVKPVNSLHFDWWLFALVALLVVIGLFFQLSASSAIGSQLFLDKMYFFKQHLLQVMIAIGLGSVAFYLYSSKKWQDNAIKSLVLGFVLLLITLIFGFENNGASRWLSIGGFKISTFPCVLLLTIVFLSHFFTVNLPPKNLFSTAVLKILLAYSCLGIILYLQPDFDAMILLAFVIWILCVFAKWVKLSVLFPILTVSIFISIALFSPYRMHRIISFIRPFDDQWGSGYQLVQSLTAIAGGDWWGVGFGKGLIKHQFPSGHEGFVLATMAEELGVLFILLLSLISTVIFIRCFVLVNKLFQAGLRFDGFLVLALSSCFALFSMSNVAVICGLLPTSNIPYPFISYAGSYLVFFCVAFGFILRIDSNSRALLVNTEASEAVRSKAFIPCFSAVLAFTVISNVFLGYHLINKALFSDQLDKYYAQYIKTYQKNSHSSISKPDFFSERGVVLDRHGVILAKNIEMADIAIDPSRFRLRHPKISELSKLLNIKITSLIASVSKLSKADVQYHFLKRSIDIDTAKIIHGFDIDGLFVKSVSRRQYPKGEQTAALLGLTDIDNVGLTGIELAHDTKLSNKQTVRLTIDSQLQAKAYKQLEYAVIQQQATNGSVIIADSATGEILTMVTYPSIEPNERYSVSDRHLKNITIANLYEPRDLLKPFVVAAANNTRGFHFDSLIDTSPGQIKIETKSQNRNRLTKIEDEENFGAVSLLELLNTNSPVGLVKLAQSIPKEIVSDIFTDVGFGVKTDLEFAEEPRVRMLYSKGWSDEKLLDIVIGRGFMATPAQILQAYIPFANEGIMHRLSIWKDTQTKHRYSTLMTPHAARTIKESMKIETPATSEFSLYGKSTLIPTPHFRDKDKNKYYASIFVGLAELENVNIAIITVINGPKQQASATDVAQQVSIDIVNKST